MLFKKLFRQPWQHRNPDLRAQAVRELEPNHPVLAEMVLKDPDRRVRQIVAARLVNLDLLRQVYLADPEPTVREQAEKRLRQLLCDQGQCPDHIEVSNGQARRAVLKQLMLEERAASLVEYLVQNAQEMELRRQLLNRIQRQGLLGNIALRDPSAEVRLAALERVSQESTLQRIAKEARKRDKRLARAARERLERMQQSREGDQRRTDIIASMRGLAAKGGLDAVAAHKLDQAWQEWGLTVQPPASMEQRQAYADAKQAFEQAAAVHQDQHQAQSRVNELIQRAQVLFSELARETRLDATAESSLSSALLMLENAWEDARQQWFDVNVNRADRPQALSMLDEQFRQSLGDALHRIALLHEHRAEMSYLEELLDAVRHLADTDNGVTRNGLKKLAQRWQGASRMTASEEDLRHDFDALDKRFAQALDKAEQDLTDSHQIQARLDKGIQSLFGDLSEAIADGQLKQAFRLRDRLRQDIETLRRINRSAAAVFDAPFKRASAKLNELRQWRNFAADRVREDLLVEAQQLAAQGLSVAELEKAVPDLRKRWNALYRNGGKPEADQETAFDAALAEAFVPVQAARENAREERQASALQRDTLIGEVEQLAAQWVSEVDKEGDTDWAALDKTVRQARQLWRDAGHVDGALYRNLKSRFDTALAPVVEPLEKERAANRQWRQGLIEQAEALMDLEDIDQAIHQAKDLQRSWKVTASGPRKREQAMWTRFRTALDAVFERRDQQRHAQQAVMDAARQEIASRMDGLSQELEALTDSAFGKDVSKNDVSLSLEALAEGLKDLRKRLLQMQGPDLEALELKAPELKADDTARKRLERFYTTRHEQLGMRLDEADQALNRRLAEQHQRFLLQRSEGLEQKAMLCESVEALVENGAMDADALNHAQERWASLPQAEDGELDGLIQRRFDAAVSAAGLLRASAADAVVYPAELLQSNLSRRQSLILRMELLSGVESPPEYQDQRMSLKVAELSAALAGDPSPTKAARGMEDWEDLLREWCLCGPVPASAHAGLHERFANCIQALS